ncbi:MAG: alpha-amylase/4-alpha-glucanotransferase domain-containing protein [Sulfuricurvum sp.]
MGTTHFLFGIHCHQPTDNFSSVVNEAILKSYRPFFEVASRYEAFHFSVHFSGWLLEYIRMQDSVLFKLMQEMALRNQIEFFSGGFYEPILSAIPSQDRIDQVTKLNDYIQTHFHQIPRGLWLTERVWDSGLISDMKKCGIDYMVVDDYHFISTGFDQQNLYGYYLSENNGETMALFPINKTLRYLIPFKEVHDATQYLCSLSSKEDKTAILFDDGEKFGVWPQTYEWVYGSGWLEQFLDAIGKKESVRTTTYGEYFDTHKALGLAYLPAYSYYEMGEWSLNSKDAIAMERMKAGLTDYSEDERNKFFKGTIWKNFLVKYYESNHIHKRTLELSTARHEVNEKEFDEWLFKAQTNDVLWHGIFGGLYLPNLRDNAYRFIIQAENLRYGITSPRLEVNDFNMDSYQDLKFIGNRFIALFDSRRGGQMSELSLRDVCFNLQNTLRRYEEPYHEKILSEQKKVLSEESYGIDTIHNLPSENIDTFKEMLVFDWYAKNSFIDHITDEEFDAERFGRCTFTEYGDFTNHPFNLSEEGNCAATFTRHGGIYIHGIKYESTLAKQYRFLEEGIEFEIGLNSDYPGSLYYLLEMNFHFAQLKYVFINGNYMENQPFSLKENILIMEDPYTSKEITITVNAAQQIVLAPTNTVSQSESGFELTNQGISIAFVVPYTQDMSITGSMIIRNKGISRVTF